MFIVVLCGVVFIIVLCGVRWFFVSVRVSLIQIDISTQTHYRSDEDLDINVADPGV
jgi:hypothetical protein